MQHVTMRLAGGCSYEEVAAMLQAARPTFEHLTAPAGEFTKAWVAPRARELRAEIEKTGAAHDEPSVRPARHAPRTS